MTQTEVNLTSEKTNLEILPLCMALKQTVGFFSSPVTRVSVICEAAVESNPELLKRTKVRFKLKWFVITGIQCKRILI